MARNKQTEALIITCVFPAVSAVFVILRSWSRFLGKNFGWDDGLICVSLVILLGETLTMYEFILHSHTGIPKAHRPSLTIPEQVTVLKWSFAVQLFYHPLMGAIRASIIMFLFRVQDNRKFIRIALHTVFWINMGYMVSTTLVNIFQCSPVDYVYMRPALDQPVNGKIVPHGKCINSLAFILASCALSIFMDLIIIPIPTAMVWNLQLRWKIKVAVVIIMSMGWIATAASVARFHIYYHRFSPSQRDRTYDIGLVISIVEPSLGIIAACAPALKSLMSRILPRFLSFSGDVNYYPTPRSRTNSFPGSSRRPSAAKMGAAGQGNGRAELETFDFGWDEHGHGDLGERRFVRERCPDEEYGMGRMGRLGSKAEEGGDFEGIAEVESRSGKMSVKTSTTRTSAWEEHDHDEGIENGHKLKHMLSHD